MDREREKERIEKERYRGEREGQRNEGLENERNRGRKRKSGLQKEIEPKESHTQPESSLSASHFCPLHLNIIIIIKSFCKSLAII